MAALPRTSPKATSLKSTHIWPFSGTATVPGTCRSTRMNGRPFLVKGRRALNVRNWVIPTGSDLRSFRKFESVFYIHAKVADGAFDFDMPEQDLNGTQVAGCLVDDRSLGAPERVGAVFLDLKAD